ncbi:HtaA domain-containing protein [Streptomyces sp. NPDC048639]|uniref:HtaA domain-containing protein n=1 Tax=Streptomyces sp. NPDC048639 TaxID=3365581 RepID=UPI003719E134
MLPSGPARTLAAVLLLSLAGITLLPAQAARAEDRTVAGGRLDWGIKSSFQRYVTGPIAQGRWSLMGGAATVGDSGFRFHSAAGRYDPDTGAFRARYSGGVHFTGHRQKDGTHRLDLTISRPTVRISGGSGTLYADMTSRARDTGAFTTAGQVPLATLDLSGVSMRGGGSTVVLGNLPATLTAQGAKAFAGYYTAGTPLDPVSLSADVTASGRTTPDASSTDGGKKEDRQQKPASHGEFRDAAVDWGVRRTWREYVTGSVAQGAWKVSDGARDGGALFRFPAGHGSYDRKKATLDARFAGRIRFTGRHGLDLTLSAVQVKVRGREGALRADVRTPRLRERNVPLAEFAVDPLRPEDGLITVSEAPAKLTAEGARVFGGVYRAGTAMDPVSLAVPLDADAELPPLPDLGDDAGTQTEGRAQNGGGSGQESTEPRRAASSSDTSLLVPVTVGAGVACIVAAAGVVAVRRKRSATVAAASAPASTGDGGRAGEEPSPNAPPGDSGSAVGTGGASGSAEGPGGASGSAEGSRGDDRSAGSGPLVDPPGER